VQSFPSNRLELYQAKLSSKKSWGKNAEALQRAATLLEPEVRQICKQWRKILEGERPATFSDGVIRVYLLLQAYALEIFVKGELVKKWRGAIEITGLRLKNFPTNSARTTLLKSRKKLVCGCQTQIPIY
jgi:hypothetical protein